MSSMPIFRMPVVLHANSPNANCPSTNLSVLICILRVFIFYWFFSQSDYFMLISEMQSVFGGCI